MGRQAFGTHIVYRETFCKSNGVFFSISSASVGSYRSVHTSPHVMSESQTPVQDQRCQSRPTPKNSVIPGEEGFSKNCGQTNNDCRFQIFILTNTPTTFACLKIEDKTEVCIVHNFCGSYSVDERSGVG